MKQTVKKYLVVVSILSMFSQIVLAQELDPQKHPNIHLLTNAGYTIGTKVLYEGAEGIVHSYSGFYDEVNIEFPNPSPDFKGIFGFKKYLLNKLRKETPCAAGFCKGDFVLLNEGTMSDVTAIYTNNAGYNDDVKIALKERGRDFKFVANPEDISPQVRCNEDETLCVGDYARPRGTMFSKVKILRLFKNGFANVVDNKGRIYITSIDKMK